MSPKKPPRTKLRLPNPESLSPDTTSDTRKMKNKNTVEEYDSNVRGKNILTKAEIHHESTAPSYEESHVQERKLDVTTLAGRAANKSFHYQPRISSLTATNMYPFPQMGADNEEDSKTLNTDSLINYLNDGLLKGSGGRITKTKSASKTPRSNACSHQFLPQYSKKSQVGLTQTYEPVTSTVNKDFYLKRGNFHSDLPRSKTLGSRGLYTNNRCMEDYEQHRLYGVQDKNEGIRNSIAEDQTYSKYRYQHPVSFEHPNISNNLHELYGGGTYTTFYGKHSDKVVDNRRFINNSRYDDFTKEKRLYLKRKPHQEKLHNEKEACFRNAIKPVRQIVRKSKRNYSPQRHKKRTKGSSKVRKLRQFDSRYPEIYKSMYDLHTRPRQRSKEKRKNNSRRSRSLSPGMSVHKDRNSRSDEYMVDGAEVRY